MVAGVVRGLAPENPRGASDIKQDESGGHHVLFRYWGVDARHGVRFGSQAVSHVYRALGVYRGARHLLRDVFECKVVPSVKRIAVLHRRMLLCYARIGEAYPFHLRFTKVRDFPCQPRLHDRERRRRTSWRS